MAAADPIRRDLRPARSSSGSCCSSSSARRFRRSPCSSWRARCRSTGTSRRGRSCSCRARRLAHRGHRLVPARPRPGPPDPEDCSAGSRFRPTPASARRSRFSSAGACPRCSSPSSSRASRPSRRRWRGRPAPGSTIPPLRRGGALLWAGAGVAAGMVFHRAIDRALAFLASIGGAAFVLLGAALVVFIAFKWWQRRRFYKFLRMARISVDDLHTLMDEGTSPIVLDVRTATGAVASIPAGSRGASVLDVGNLDAALRGPAPRPGDHPLLHLTQRSLGRPCGAHADRQGVHAGAAARRRARRLDRRGLRDRGRAADRDPAARFLRS